MIYQYVNTSHLPELSFSTAQLATLASDGSYHDVISFKCSSTHPHQQFVVSGEYSHKTEACSPSPVKYLGITYLLGMELIEG